MISPRDGAVIRGLAEKLADLAADPRQSELRELWISLCRLERTRPLIRLYDWTGWANDPAVVNGSVVVSSPGWGYVNHSGNVNMIDKFNQTPGKYLAEVAKAAKKPAGK